MFQRLIFLFTLIASLCWACTSTRNAASGFDWKGSDAQAIQIADDVMNAMGGKQAWDETRFISWNFFGRRIHHWDKLTGNVHIESINDNTVYMLNIHSMEGQVERLGDLISDPDTLAKMLKKAKSMWINDSYWLVMPFKLKDSGVTLKYLGAGKTENGKAADILQLTFKSVGDTPENKYHVYVDKETKLVTQWAYFKKASDEKPEFINPWEGYQQYGNILLSGGRGFRGISDIAVYAELPAEMFKMESKGGRRQ
jgi:hypothetical protein